MIQFQPTVQFNKQAAILLFDQGQIKKQKFGFDHKFLEDRIKAIVSSNQFSADKDQIFPILIDQCLVLLVGLGKREKCSSTALRMTLRKAILSSYLSKIKDMEIAFSDHDDTHVKAMIEAIAIGTYRWKKYCTKASDDKSVNEKDFTLIAQHKKIYDDTITICQGVNLARDLVNDNADTITSDYIEKTIRDLIKGKKNVALEVLNGKELKARELNLHLAVNQGSQKEPKLVIVKYSGSTQKGNDTALIGKGITFDTGGLNIKPTGSMETMRTDMSGAAAVLGTLKNCLSLNLKKNVLFVFTLAENAIGSMAFKPGDVFRGYSGKTVEIGNTDAEGRLVLADAISYTIKNYKPARIIDIATLTGACVVALGHDYTGLVTTDDQLSRQLVQASDETDDRVWRLPSYPELDASVKSKVADIKNIGFPRGAGGAITAAEFLRQFTEGTLWAHLDIAGTAFVDGDSRMYFSHGATGAGVRLMTNFLRNN